MFLMEWRNVLIIEYLSFLFFKWDLRGLILNVISPDKEQQLE